MTYVYDAGVLVAAERGDRQIWADHAARLEIGVVPLTTAPVVAQVSRSARQVHLRRLLRGCEVVAFQAEDAHDVGALAGSAGVPDVVDAHVVWVAKSRDASVLTSDGGEMARLGETLGGVRIVPL